MKFRFLLVATFGLVTGISFAQHQEVEPCATDHVRQQLWEEFPELEKANQEYEQLLQSMSNRLKDGEEEEDDILPDDLVITIPVVFHVLHEYGSENISDEQIYDQMRILNEDFRKQNPDISEVVPAFMSIAADSKIEFKLASLDPFGNPTNGIVRHFSNETNIGDAYSKLEQWPRSRYLNIWTMRMIGTPGVAGYSNYPVDVEDGLRFLDGVVILNTYVGSIGTSNPYSSRAITHEVGHWLNLAHTWGSTNQPGVACGDDGVEDTPRTRGWNHCNDVYGATCGNEIDNIQNYMEYAYCSNMYTQGQVTRMRNALRLDVSQRSNLWQEANIEVSVPEGQVFDPVADFYVDYQANKDRLVARMGDEVKFKNWSNRLVDGDVNYTWTFEDGSVETSNEKDPTVSFTSQGWKSVSLTVENNGRTHTVTKDHFIWIAPNWSVFPGNVTFDFNDNPDYWVILNPTNRPYRWNVRNDAGVNGSGAIFLDIANHHTNPDLFSDEYFFSQRRGGVENAFVTQPINLAYHIDKPILSFDFACATEGLSLDQITEKLEVFVSRDGGKNWQRRKEIKGTELVNNGAGWDSFYPNSTTEWTNVSFELASADRVEGALIKFVYTASDKSNNIAIDNINISGTLGTVSLEKNNINIYPNPSSLDKGWNINYDSNTWGGGTIELTDMAGRVITQTVLPENQSEFNIKPSNEAAKGVYFITIQNNEHVIQSKLILK